MDIMLHFGTLLSLLAFLYKDIIQILRSLFRFCLRPKRFISDPNIHLFFALILATLPIALIGYFMSDFFESLFGSLRAVGISLCMTGCFLYLTKSAKKRKMNLVIHPVLIGILQAVAVVPGLSRSGLTIGGALLLGWKESFAARFSFLLSIPAIAGASLFQISKINMQAQEWPLILTGICMAALCGYLALKYLTVLIKKGKFFYFSFYCLIAGVLTLVLSFILQ